MVGAGYLVLDVKGHGGLSISEKGRAFLKEGAEFRYRKDMVRRSRGKERRQAAIADARLTAEQEELLARLKALRFELSRRRRVPPYVIFSDRTLIDMAQRSPRSQEALTRMVQGRTSIIIAHRLSTVQRADKIIVMHKSQLREMGSHQELLAQRGIYWKLYQLQYKDQELPTTSGTLIGSDD